MEQHKRVVVAKTPTASKGARTPKKEADLTVAQVCYFYPVYSLSEARRLPAKDVILLLQVAQQQKAREYFELTQISTAPHTKGGRGVRKLLDKYKELANG